MMYNCNTKLHSGTNPIGMATFDAWGKPLESYESDVPDYVPDQVLAYRKNVNYFHTFGVMLTFVGFALWVNYIYTKERENNPEATSEELKNIVSQRLIGIRTFIGIFGTLAVAFHGYRFFIKQRVMRADDDISYMYGINVLHLVIGSYMAYVAYDTTVDNANYLGFLGVVAGLFHGYLSVLRYKKYLI